MSTPSHHNPGTTGEAGNSTGCGWRLGPEVLEHPVVGTNLRGRVLRDELDSASTLLVFLRHLG